MVEAGIVKWFHPSKGYGFIRPLQRETKDVFVHMSTVRACGMQALIEGQRVTFQAELRQGRLTVSKLATSAQQPKGCISPHGKLVASRL